MTVQSHVRGLVLRSFYGMQKCSFVPTRGERRGYLLGHLKNAEVFIFDAALGFSHYLVHLMPISTILSKIDQYLDLPGFEVFMLKWEGQKFQVVKY